MKRKVLLWLLGGLIIACLLGLGTLIVRDALRTPTEYWMLAKEALHAQKYPQAARYMKKAADGGFTRAQYELALMYDAGDKIVENREQAKYYLNKALTAQLPEAFYVRAVWEERGYYGTPDMKRAIDYYEFAAQKGYLNAMKSLIVLYGEGIGDIPYNLQRRAYWLVQVQEKTPQQNKVKQ